MNIRQLEEERERRDFSEFACLSENSRGRKRPEEPCDIRTCFMRDRDRIIHSKSFRRLKHKTQVFISPEGDHYRTRLTHTLEVSGIARTIARALHLNENLCEAIAMGHDLGHTPFGHGGERELSAITDGRFSHNLQSVRVAERIERNGRGLNLTHEVLNGIACHSGDKTAETLEGKIVALSDRIAYINHDIDDACRGGMLHESDIPGEFKDILGHRHSKRINTLVLDTISASEGKDDILMSDEVHKAMMGLRAFMFEHVYR
ncbi:MAG: deoxyguanosinetriphosphate triphosphohydrolase, partial [Oscillospiraceae bacterium]|nr:deoxyguanosinetriphosphate triphosphohydrolase [Oscillospiraceae bacterium]